MGSAMSYFRDELFGVINEETPKYEEVEKTADFEIRQYGPAIVAETIFKGRRGQSKGSNDAFWVLAGYIGAVSAPKNTKPAEQGSTAEAIAMTAPVIMQESKGQGAKGTAEAIAMTAPVIMTEAPGQGVKGTAEVIAMTAPVIMTEAPGALDAAKTAGPDTSEADLMSRAFKAYMDLVGSKEEQTPMSMQFVLPSKYTLDTVPRPLDPRVTVKEIPGKKVGAVVFSGAWNEDQFKAKAEKLREALLAAGHKPRGEYMSCMYNSPMALPAYRRNEIWYELEA